MFNRSDRGSVITMESLLLPHKINNVCRKISLFLDPNPSPNRTSYLKSPQVRGRRQGGRGEHRGRRHPRRLDGSRRRPQVHRTDDGGRQGREAGTEEC